MLSAFPLVDGLIMLPIATKIALWAAVLFLPGGVLLLPVAVRWPAKPRRRHAIELAAPVD